MLHKKIPVILLSSIVMTSYGRADESNETRPQAANDHQEVVEQDRESDVAHLKAKANETREQAGRFLRHRPERNEADIKITKRILDLLRAKERELERTDGSEEQLYIIRSKANRVERELLERSRSRRSPRDLDPPEVARRLGHMRIAVEHLEQAGMDGEAKEIARRAEAMERSLHDHHRRDGGASREIARHIEELRREVRRLSDQVNELMDQRISHDPPRSRRRDRGDAKGDPPRRRSPQRDSDPDPSPENRGEQEIQE